MTFASFRLGCFYLGRGGALLLFGLSAVGLADVIGGAAGLANSTTSAPGRIRTGAQVIEKGKDLSPNPAPKLNPRGVPQAGDPLIYWVQYTYRDRSGREYSSRDTVAADLWERCQKGTAIAVEYSEERPEDNRVVTEDASSPWVGAAVAIGVGLLALAMATLVAVKAWKDVVPRVRLIRDGVPALGRVLQIVARGAPAIVQGGEPRLSHHLQFRFADSEGREYVGESPALSARLKNRWRPGDPILVCYQRENPTANEADLSGARADELVRLLAGPQS